MALPEGLTKDEAKARLVVLEAEQQELLAFLAYQPYPKMLFRQATPEAPVETKTVTSEAEEAEAAADGWADAVTPKGEAA